jgi:hypothetical protein
MKKILFLCYAALIIGIVLPGCNGSKSGSADVVELKLNLEKGKTYVYATKTNMTMDMDMMGKSMTTTANIDFGFKMKVDDIDPQHNYNVTASYDAIRFKMNAMGMDMGYDSKNPGDTSKENMMNGMFRKIFSSMVGKSFKLLMSSNGEVMKIDGLKELVESMSANINVPEAMREQMKKQMNESFNEDQIRQSFAQAFSIYPDKPVKVGDSWTKTTGRVVNNMNMNQDIKYTVKEIRDNSVLLDMDGTIKSSQATDSVAAKVDMSGNEKGTMELQRTTGMVNHGNIDMDLKLSTMGHPMNMKMNISIEGKE